MSIALVNALFESDFWSTRQLLAACRALPPEQFERVLGLGPGSLERTLTHSVGTMFFFADRLNRQPPRPRLEKDGQRHRAEELTTLFEQGAAELMQAVSNVLAARRLDDTLNWTDSDDGETAPEDKITYAVALAQMVDHGIHHRTQAMDMLTLLGVPGAMDWHPFDWDEAVRP